MRDVKPMESSDQMPLLIRSRGLRGLGLGAIAGVTAIWALVAALAGQVFNRPLLLWYWIGSIALLLILGLLLEASFRRDRVAIQEGPLRWRLRGGARWGRAVSVGRGGGGKRDGNARIVFGWRTLAPAGGRWVARR